MDPPQGYDEASQLIPLSESQLGPEAAYPSEYQPVISVIPIYDQLQTYLSIAEKAFNVSFTGNEKGVKNPAQVTVDDTLYCMPNKPICAYLGEKIFPIEGYPLPRIYVYLKYKDDKNKNTKVVTCDVHRKDLENPYHVLQSDNVDVKYEDNGSAYVLNFAYPQAVELDDAPSISFRFVCASSCCQRLVFELHFELVFPDVYIGNTLLGFSRKQLVKVSANPGRDSGQLPSVSNQFLRAKNAFCVTKKPRARKITDASDGGPSSKRSVSGSEQSQLEVFETEQVQSEIVANEVYNLPIYGLTDYKKMVNHYNLLLVHDKYKLKKCSGRQPGVLNSQIPVTADLDAWLESTRMKKHKDLLKSRNIRTMNDLHKKYYSCIFEDLQIPSEDSKTLHCSFIYWRTNYLDKVFENVVNE